MSSSNRNPKELREHIEKCRAQDDQQFNEILDESMVKLRNISMEEKTEMGMLKSRVDDQSRLIMMLKQRCDDYIHKNMALETLNQELFDQKENIEHDLDELKQKYKQLMSRFETLSNYNEEIIRIKDEYKQSNSELKEKINELNRKLNCLNNDERIMLLEDEVKFLNNLCQENNDKFVRLKKENEAKLDQLVRDKNDELNDKIDQINELKSQLSNTDSKLKELNEMYADKKNELETRMIQFMNQTVQLNKEKDELSAQLRRTHDDLNLQLKKSQDEKRALFEKCNELEKVVKTLNEKIKNDAILFNENKFIKKLQAELDEANKRYEDLQKEFKEYKVYVNNLIEKEKEVNAKLRYLIS